MAGAIRDSRTYAVDAIDQNPFARNGTFDRRCVSLHHPDNWAEDRSKCASPRAGHTTTSIARCWRDPIVFFAVDGSRCQELLMRSTVQKPDRRDKGWYTFRVRNRTGPGGQIFRIRGQEGVLQISRQGLSFDSHCETHGGAINLPPAAPHPCPAPHSACELNTS
jgi:hypothetical protein